MRKRFIPIISLFLLLFSLSLLSYQIFKVPKEVKSIAGTLNITGTTGTFLTPGGIWNSDGSVGIGTTAPGAKLGFAAATTAAGGIDFGGDTNLYRSAANLLNTDDGFVSAAYMRAPYFQGTAINTLYPIGYATDPGLLVYTGTGAAWSERMRISGNAATANVSFSNSNVGIGTTAPGAKLDVAGTMRSTSYYYQNSNNPSLVLQDSDNRNGVIHQNSDLMYFLSGSGINGTSWTINGSYWPLTLNMNDDTATFGGPAHFMEGNVGIGTAAPTYKLQVAGTVYASGSSKRFKQNITDLKVNSEKIYDLRPVSFDYKTQYKSYGKQLGEGRQIGLIAEEVYKVIPELSIKLNNEISNVDYEKLSILLLVESKKQKKEINSLKLEIKNLEQRLILVESKLK